MLLLREECSQKCTSVCPESNYCSMIVKAFPSTDISLKNISALAGNRGGQGTLLLLPLLLPSVCCSLFTMIMLLCTNEVSLACSMSKDGPAGAIFGMEHWRVGGHIHRKFQPISSGKSGQKQENSAATATVLLLIHVTLSVAVS